MYERVEEVEAGGLIPYGPNLPDLFRRAATYVDKSSKALDLLISLGTANEIRAHYQSQSSKADRADDSTDGAGTGR
jgi:hypothetical protein